MATLQRQNSALSSNPFLVQDRERKARGGLSDGTADRALRWAAKAKAHKEVLQLTLCSQGLHIAADC